MTVPEILEQIGWPLGRYGRTTCPIHRGKNPQSFSYELERWYCFRGCGGGGVVSLARVLGVLPQPSPRVPVMKPGLVGFGGIRELSVPRAARPRATQRMEQEVSRLRAQRLHDAAALHGRGEGLMRMAVTRLARTAPDDEESFLVAAELWTGGKALTRIAHETVPCPGCEG